MSLAPGTRLGPYQVVAPLGAGGMGEVYRATDTKLGRDVAIKILPESFSSDPERLARFQREAHLLASLNHPNIAAIYGLEESGGVRALVMELVDGPTLAERGAAGPIPLDEALPMARQIADALEAAHEKGIVHRDLKPANVKVTAEGKVKVLDFGLAKAFAADAPASDPSCSPTISLSATRAGVILGTAAYMSPEQSRGKPVDKRSDIWSFGCVLYEALAGRRAFAAETITETMAAIQRDDPDWNALPTHPPASIQRLLRRCLEKDPNRRLRDIGDARIEIEEALAGPASTPDVATAVRRAGWQQPAMWIVIGLVLGAVAVWRLQRPTPAVRRPVARLVVALSQNAPLAARGFTTFFYPLLALSPDGTQLVYVAGPRGHPGGSTQLYLRPLDRLEATPIPGTEGASSPFFSPDGQWLGFFADDKLKKVALAGGPPVTLCEAKDARGASWGSDDTIIVSTIAGVQRISSAGGEAQSLTITVLKKEQRIARWPEILPGGKAVLFTSGAGGTSDELSIGLKSLDTGEQRILVEKGYFARYSPTGHLVFGQSGMLMAAPFDLRKLALTGPAVPVLESVMSGQIGAAQFSFSNVGSLAYMPGRVAERRLVWVDRRGAAQPLPAPGRSYVAPSISPDGRRIAVTVEAPSKDVWIYETARDTLTRFTSEGSNADPFWTPDGKRITFISTRPGRYNLFWQPADGSGPAEQLLASEHVHFPGSWSPDGKVLAFTEWNPTGYDLWTLRLPEGASGERRLEPFLRTSFLEMCPRFSPDGRWLAYVSNESGRNEVYVQPSSGGGRWQISSEGGSQSVWARSGRELFYRNGDRFMSAAVTTKPDFQAAKPVLLFDAPYEPGFGPWVPNYDVSPDGQRFLMIQAVEQSEPVQVHLVLEWFEDLKRRAAPAK